MKKTIKAIDLDYNFKAHPVSGNLILSEDQDAIKQSVKTLILLNIFEKPFSVISGNLRNKLFENFNIVLEDQLKDQIASLLRIYEPRVFVENIRLYQNFENDLNITITYQIIGEEALPQEVSLVVSRTR